MDSRTLEGFQQKWEAVANAEQGPGASELSEKAQKQQRLSLACTLAKEYLSLGLPPPPSTAALTGHALEHYRKHKLQRKPRATAEVLDRLRDALGAQENLLRTQQASLQAQAQAQAQDQSASPAQGVAAASATDGQLEDGHRSRLPHMSGTARMSRSGRSGTKAARRAELQDAVQRLRDALFSADAEAGQQAADQVANLLRASAGNPARARDAPKPPSPRREARRAAGNTKQPAQERGRSPLHTARDAMTQTAAARPQTATPSGPRHSRASRDAASSPPPPQGLGEGSLRFRARPEWDDSFHLTKPTTPRPPGRSVVYQVDDTYSPRGSSAAAQKLSAWRNAKRIEMARSLSPRREVPVSLSLMSTALRQQSLLGRTSSRTTPRAATTQRAPRTQPKAAPLSPRRAHKAPAGSGPNSDFQAQQLHRVEELESRMSRLIAAVEQRLATTEPSRTEGGY